MPTASPRPCLHPGCPALHSSRTGRCPQHAEQAEAARQASIDQHRPSSAARGYDSIWRRFRQSYLAIHRYCPCGELATDVDHIRSVALFPELKFDPTNLRALCHKCHSRRTATDQGFARRA